MSTLVSAQLDSPMMLISTDVEVSVDKVMFGMEMDVSALLILLLIMEHVGNVQLAQELTPPKQLVNVIMDLSTMFPKTDVIIHAVLMNKSVPMVNVSAFVITTIIMENAENAQLDQLLMFN